MEDPGPPQWWTEMRAGQQFLFDMAGEPPPPEPDDEFEIEEQPLCHRCNINFERSEKAVVKPQHERHKAD
jgi:hypothetical protein